MIETSQQKTIDIVIPVKNGGDSILVNIKKWLNQKTPQNWDFLIYLVDDGSTDNTFLRVREKFQDEKKLIIIHNQKTQGRAQARNQGADAGHGDFIAFFDADCSPSFENTIAAYIDVIESSGALLMFGSLKAKNNDVFGKYFQEVADRREKIFLEGDKSALTTANCLMCRNLFYIAGKYDERYLRYGFEDKDLILRLIKNYDAAVYVKNAGVIHGDILSLQEVCNKMYIAGKYTSAIFQKDHPVIYKKMPFYQADMRHKSTAFFIIIRLFNKANGFILSAASRLINLPLPYKFKRAIIKYCSGLFFAFGSANSSD